MNFLKRKHCDFILNIQKQTTLYEIFHPDKGMELLLSTAISVLQEGVVENLSESSENRSVFFGLKLCGVNSPVAVAIRILAEKLAKSGKNKENIDSWVSHRVKEELKNASKVSNGPNLY